MSDAATILLDAATVERQPAPFTVNSALRDAGVSDVCVRELLDRRLHVFDHTTPGQRIVLPLDTYCDRLLG